MKAVIQRVIVTALLILIAFLIQNNVFCGHPPGKYHPKPSLTGNHFPGPASWSGIWLTGWLFCRFDDGCFWWRYLGSVRFDSGAIGLWLRFF